MCIFIIIYYYLLLLLFLKGSLQDHSPGLPANYMGRNNIQLV